MNEAKQMLNATLCGTTVTEPTVNLTSSGTSAWGYWQDYYYPQVITQSYPVYIQERAKDKGHQAYEIIKTLLDKKLIKLDKVSDFVEAMDCLIKIL
jgi:hypothetical protein